MDGVQCGGMLEGLRGDLRRIDDSPRQFVGKDPTHGDLPGGGGYVRIPYPATPRGLFGYAREVSAAADTQWIQ
ncbi:MAG: hypothetical protein A2V70_02680 [Planctomycetes bacterium RBG_13_63_9]|nr:MAG: hypothetical protein A2V70_02680 [Planctomycetes bacterium RBG_13_63_9]